jgi:hypothetical protein
MVIGIYKTFFHSLTLVKDHLLHLLPLAVGRWLNKKEYLLGRILYHLKLKKKPFS